MKTLDVVKSMRSLALLLLAMPAVLHAQTEGVRFERALNWEQVQAKAAATNKHILAYVCVPRDEGCVMLDTEMFAQARVGAAINDRLLAVKVRFDTANVGGSEDDSLYIDSPAVRQYNISSFPTFLVFRPDGKLVHRRAGLLNIRGMLALAAEALDPARQYYVQLERYEGGVRDYSVLAHLARTARELNETDLARRVAHDYIDHLLATNPYTRDNIIFITQFTERSTDAGFNMLVRHADTVDRIMERRGLAQALADQVIRVEEIRPLAFPGRRASPTPPDWAAITVAIERKHGATYADRTVRDAQFQWYRAHKNWSEVVRLAALQLQRYGSSLEAGVINDMAWELFTHSDDRGELDTGIRAMEPVVKGEGSTDPALIDTYANLLYKIGRTAEALAWQERAVTLAKDSFQLEEYAANLAKMKRGEPTWPTEY